MPGSQSLLHRPETRRRERLLREPLDKKKEATDIRLSAFLN